MKATRQQLWELDLAAKDEFMKYYFALYRFHYARTLPIYLSEMYRIQTENKVSWDLKTKNFCVNKFKKLFVDSGVDHALEQVNREARGGITGLLNDAIYEHCYTIPVKQAILKISRFI